MEKENQGVQPVVPQQPVAPVAQPAPVAPAQAGLPQDAKERTRAEFEKLLDSNKKLFEQTEALRRELAQRSQAQEYFAPTNVQPGPRQQQPTGVNYADFVEIDPVTGESYLNQEKLAAKLADATQRASRAEQVVQNYIKTNEEREVEKQNKEAITAYPELNPNDQSKFDAAFSRQVRAILVDSMYNMDEYGGRPLSFKEAADFVRQQYPKSQPTPSNEPTPEQLQAAQEGRELKEQGSAQASSQPQPTRYMEADEEIVQLRERTRFGDTQALARRLLHTPHILPKDAQEVS